MPSPGPVALNCTTDGDVRFWHPRVPPLRSVPALPASLLTLNPPLALENVPPLLSSGASPHPGDPSGTHLDCDI